MSIDNTDLFNTIYNSNTNKANKLISKVDANQRVTYVNGEDKHGNTPLYVAISNKMNNFTNLLLEYGANINQKNNSGDTILHRLVQSMHSSSEAIELALKYGANIEAKTSKGYTPLQLAFFSKNISIIESLLKNHANINVRDQFGDTLLYTAAFQKDHDIINLLFNYGAKIEERENVADGATCTLELGKSCSINRIFRDYKGANKLLNEIYNQNRINTAPTIESTMKEIYSSNERNKIVDTRNNITISSTRDITVSSNSSQNATGMIDSTSSSKAIGSAQDSTATVLMTVLIPIGVIATLARLYCYKTRNRTAGTGVSNSLAGASVANPLLHEIEMQ